MNFPRLLALTLLVLAGCGVRPAEESCEMICERQEACSLSVIPVRDPAASCTVNCLSFVGTNRSGGHCAESASVLASCLSQASCQQDACAHSNVIFDEDCGVAFYESNNP